jgi:hypothetical protein
MAIVRKVDDSSSATPDGYRLVEKANKLTVWRAMFGDGRGMILTVGDYEMLLASDELPVIRAVINDILSDPQDD